MRDVVLCVVAVVLGGAAALGCGSGAERSVGRPASAPPLPVVPTRHAFDPDAPPPAPRAQGRTQQEHVAFTADSLELSARPGVASSAMKATGRFLASQSFSAASGASAPSLPVAEASPGENIEREAPLAVAVDDVAVAASAVARLVQAHEGSITKEERSSAATSHAELLVRVPSARFESFVAAVGKVGEIQNRRIRVIDATLEHHDLETLVRNLEAAMARYTELLAKAEDAAQVLAVEREIERVRSELDRIQTRLAYLRDRVANATIAIALRSPEPEADIDTGFQPRLTPGLRALSLVDVREGGTNTYLGSGLSLRLPRAIGQAGRGLVLDVDVLRACCKSRPERSSWGYMVLGGLDLYSDALEAGRRRWLNPYLGLRAGFAQTQDRGDFAAAGVFGLEIWKTRALTIDVQARLLALVGNPDGPHVAIQPSLGFDAGF